MSVNNYSNKITIKPEMPLHSPAHPGTKQLRIVCKKRCNEGWMNLVEQAAFDCLSNLVTHGVGVLDIKSQRAIALYMGIFFSMADREHLPTSSITQQERTYIYEQHGIPAHWLLFLGRSGDSDWQYRFRHHGGDFKIFNSDIGLTSHKYHVCTAGVGKLIMHAVSSPDMCLLADPNGYARAIGFALIHPHVGTVDVASLPWLSGEQVDIAADAFVMTKVVENASHG